MTSEAAAPGDHPADLRSEGSRLIELARNGPVLVGSALGVSLGLALFPVYVMPLLGLQFERLFGWGRVENASLISAMGVGGIVGLLYAGRIVDAFGARWPAVAATAAMGALLTTAPLLPPTVNTWRAGAFLFALLGCCSGPVAYTRAICDTFFGARGLALGLTLGAIGLAGAIMPSVLIALIGKFGAQHGLQVLGAAYIFVLAPLLAVLLRNSGRGGAALASSLAAEPIIRRISRWRWLVLTAGFALLSSAGFGAASCIPALARDTHAGPPALIMAMLSLTIMAARPLSGFLIDHAAAQIVAAAIALCTAVGLVLIAVYTPLLPLGAVLVGLSLGAEVDILAFLVSRYGSPGRESRIFAQIWFVVSVSNLLAPLAFAQTRMLTGGYSAALLIAAVGAVSGGLLIGSLPAYVRPEEELRETR